MGIPASLQATPLPAPYQLAIEPVAFQLTVLDGSAAREAHRETCVRPPMWFSVTLRAPLEKRFVYLVQHETDTGRIVLILLYDREIAGEAAAASADLRLPPSGTWLRAVVDGGVYVLASDLVLSRKSITAWLGGDEPPITMPPYT